jgi:hypothetical protein
MPDQVLSKQSEPIEQGDHVYTKIRSGRHEGDVCFPHIPPFLHLENYLILIHS